MNTSIVLRHFRENKNYWDTDKYKFLELRILVYHSICVLKYSFTFYILKAWSHLTSLKFEMKSVWCWSDSNSGLGSNCRNSDNLDDGILNLDFHISRYNKHWERERERPGQIFFCEYFVNFLHAPSERELNENKIFCNLVLIIIHSQSVPEEVACLVWKPATLTLF